MMIVKSLVVIASRGSGSRPDANKDPPSAYCVRARNIRGSESCVFDLAVYHGCWSQEKIFSDLERQIFRWLRILLSIVRGWSLNPAILYGLRFSGDARHCNCCTLNCIGMRYVARFSSDISNNTFLCHTKYVNTEV